MKYNILYSFSWDPWLGEYFLDIENNYDFYEEYNETLSSTAYPQRIDLAGADFNVVFRSRFPNDFVLYDKREE